MLFALNYHTHSAMPPQPYKWKLLTFYVDIDIDMDDFTSNSMQLENKVNVIMQLDKSEALNVINVLPA